MVSTLDSINLDTPITPGGIKPISTVEVENTLCLYSTPDTEGEKAEDEPKTPQKESSNKKRGNRIGSKRKLFLQSGSTTTQNKAKKMSNSSVVKPRKASANPVATPTVEKSAPSGYPLTERQQLQYLLEVTAKEAQKEPQESDSDVKQSQMFTRLKKKDAIKKETNSLRMSKRNERGETLLHLAAIKGDIDETVALIKAGVSVNLKDYAGWTPLHEACNFGHLNIVDELLKGGANVNVPGYEDISPLHDAVINNHVQVVELLIRYGADPAQMTMQGYTSIDLARSASILELLRSVQPSLTIPDSPQTDSSSTNPETNSNPNEVLNGINPDTVQKGSRVSLEKGFISGNTQGCFNQASPQTLTVFKGHNFDQNVYPRRGSSSSSSQVSDTEDSIDPKRLNECLDKAMLEMSSYLDPMEHPYEFLSQGTEQSKVSFVGNSIAAAAPTRLKNNDVKNFCSQQNLEKHQSTLNGQSTSVNEYKDVKQNVLTGREISVSTEVSKNSVQQDNKLYQQLDSNNCVDAKIQIPEDGNLDKENHLSQKVKPLLHTNIMNQDSSNSQVNVQKSSEVNKVVQVDDCSDHIKNPTWRKAIEMQYYNVSNLPLYVPGYNNFMLNSKSYTLQPPDSISSNISSKSENVQECELSRLKTAQQIEREKLKLCLEQEIVRLFGSFARRAIEKDVPIGACTILQQQMKTHGRKECKPKRCVDKLSGQSIKAEVEQTIQKFESMKTKLLNRQKHEIDAVIALQQLTQGETGRVISPENLQKQADLKVKDFKLLPTSFQEYYEEFLSLIDQDHV